MSAASGDKKIGPLSPNDPNSFSNPEEAKTTKLHLDWNVNFDRKVVEGTVTYTINKIPSAKSIVFDTRDLTIEKAVQLQGGGVAEKELEFHLGEDVLTFGKPLTVNFQASADAQIEIAIKYETQQKSSALLWLEKEQTSGKQFPYLFSHSEAIHSRALLPCQDTPSVKASFTAEVAAPKDLTVLMSGVRSPDNPIPSPISGSPIHYFKFEQLIPIPAYLIAFVVGKLEGEKIGPRSTVWAEKAFVKAAAYDFSETEQMLKTAEDLMGEYVWGNYDILVLPPSFPFGGMENPCLTFATPTILAGDKSLADVIAHEISHSWTGNLVTNSTFEHFWLNEGFTMFLQRKIVGRMRGEAYRQFDSIGGWKDLKDCIRTLGETNPFTRLVTDLRGVDPDDSFSSVPYEKGYVFLYFLEQKVGGGAAFEPFFKDYVQKYKKQSIDTNEFKNFFTQYFTAQGKAHLIQDIDWDTWLYAPGMPPYTPAYDTSLVEVCTELKKRWDNWNPSSEPSCPFSKGDLQKFSIESPQIQEFLSQILDDEKEFPLEKAKAMEAAYNFNAKKNSEIRFRWLRLCIKARWLEQVALALDFVTEQGRMKFIRPIYRDLYDWEEVRARTIERFEQNRPNMMYVSAYTVAKDLHLSSN